MTLRAIYQRNRTSFLFLCALLFPLLITISLLYYKVLYWGLAVWLLPIIFIFFNSSLIRVTCLTFLFYFQKYFIHIGDSIRIFPVDLLFLLLLFYFIFNAISHNKNTLSNDHSLKVLFYPYLIFSLFCVFSFFFNLYRYNEIILAVSTWYLIRCFQIVLAILMLSYVKIHSDMIEIFYDSIILCTLLQFPVAILQILNGNDMTGTLTDHHGYFGTLLIIPFLLSIYKFIRSFQNKNSISIVLFYLLSSVAFLYMIYGSRCRSALVGLIVSMFLYLLNIFIKKDLKTIGISLLLIILVLFISLKFTPLSEVVNKSLNNSDSISKVDISSLSRLLIWKYTWINFTDFPVTTKFLGIGIGTFTFLQQHFVIWNGSQTFTGAHLNLLHVLVETGIIGLICFIMIFIFTCRYFYLNRSSTIAKIGFFITISLLFSGITQETFWFQPSYGTLWLFYVIVCSLIIKQIENFKNNNT